MDVDVNRDIALGVVTYNPDSALTLRLQLAIENGFSVYVFDNSPEDGIIREFCRQWRSAATYLTCGKNVGLGFGISSVCAQAYYDTHSALLFFDQDTIFDNSTLQFVTDFHTRHAGLAASHSAVWFNAKKYTGCTAAGDRFAYQDVLMAINSGSLFFLDTVKKLKWMNEKYFVDCVDYEFCLRSNNNRFKIAECSNTPGFDHDRGQEDVKRIIFGKERKLRQYSVKRVLDTVRASSKLLITSISTGNRAFTVAIGRSVAGYLFWQGMSRILRISKTNKGR